jgi:[ribosomal protein S18]-alanine N-acetyltransferase
VDADLTILRLDSDADRERCARLMSTSDPWLTLGRTYESSYQLLGDPTREIYVAKVGEEVAGFVILLMHGAFVGYIQTICMAQEHRNRGLGRRLLAFAEERIFRESPNVFLCVSSFNTGAQRLYLRLGYELIGELKDYIMRGHSELLMRKTRGPLREFRPS